MGQFPLVKKIVKSPSHLDISQKMIISKFSEVTKFIKEANRTAMESGD